LEKAEAELTEYCEIEESLKVLRGRLEGIQERNNALFVKLPVEFCCWLAELI